MKKVLRTRLLMLASHCALRSCFSWRSLCSSRCLVATSSFSAALASSKLQQTAKPLSDYSSLMLIIRVDLQAAFSWYGHMRLLFEQSSY